MAHSAGRMRENFMYIHFSSKVAVLQEGRETLPYCKMCGIHIPAGQLLKLRRTVRHFKNTETRIRRRAVEVESQCA